MMAFFWLPVMMPCVFKSLVTPETQLRNEPPAGHWEIKSEIEQPVSRTVFGTPELQLPMTTVAARFEPGH
jgi:hypothetical protein